ncbi:MAG TPA: hypothetical protein VGN37_11485 [Actinocatenispora sp.]
MTHPDQRLTTTRERVSTAIEHLLAVTRTGFTPTPDFQHQLDVRAAEDDLIAAAVDLLDQTTDPAGTTADGRPAWCHIDTHNPQSVALARISADAGTVAVHVADGPNAATIRLTADTAVQAMTAIGTALAFNARTDTLPADRTEYRR